MLSGHHTLRLAVLNSCQGARGSVSDPFSGVAQSLVQQGIPAVVAMQFEISDQAAIIFAQELYAAIADGNPVDAAVGECRRAIFAGGNDIEWATPVLYMRSPNGQLFQVRDASSSPRRAPVPEGPSPEATVLPDLAESRVGPDGDQASAEAAASLAPPLAEPPGVGSSPRRVGRLRLVWLTVALAVLAGAGVLIADLATSSSRHSSGTVGTTISVTSHAPPTRQTGKVLSEGTASLSDPTQGFDLLTGRSAFFAESTMAWDGSQLSIFDETTLGVANLGRAPFDNVGLASLQPLRYGRGASNPPLGPSDIPAGDVLAIHVSDATYAKIEILGIDANDALHFRWVTYGTTST
jgi:hypothetical protein